MEIKITDFELKKIDYRNLKPIQGSLKDLSSKNYERLKKSFQEKGMFVPIFVWNDHGVSRILDGHGRERFFSKEKVSFVDPTGKKSHEVPCLIIQAENLKDAKEKLLIISSQYQTVTQEGFDEFTFDLDDDWLSDTIHFDGLFGSALNVEQIGEVDADDPVSEPPADPESKPGDLYQLGNHFVLCGDSTNPDHVQTLLQKFKPILMVTDPPYGVEYDPNWRTEASKNSKVGKALKTGKVLNDNRFDWSETWSLFEGDIAYVWHSALYSSEVAESLKKCDFEVRAQIIWAKNQLIISRGHYHWKHEPCWYAVRKGKTGHWQGDRKQNTLWEIEVLHSSPSLEDHATNHGTQKPVECMKRPILNHTLPGEWVYDPFLGSGSTLIACEMTGRKCIGLELSPSYVDVIVQRWEKFTGKKAERING